MTGNSDSVNWLQQVQNQFKRRKIETLSNPQHYTRKAWMEGSTKKRKKKEEKKSDGGELRDGLKAGTAVEAGGKSKEKDK